MSNIVYLDPTWVKYVYLIRGHLKDKHADMSASSNQRYTQYDCWIIFILSYSTYNSSLQARDDGRGGIESDAVDEDSRSDPRDKTSGPTQRRPKSGDDSVHGGIVGITSVPR